MDQQMISASSPDDKQTVAQHLAIRRRRHSWLPRKVAELTTKKVQDFTQHHLNVEKSAKFQRANCSVSTQQAASGLATGQPKIEEQNVKQHIRDATKQRSKTESAKQTDPGGVKPSTTQKKKRKSLLACAQQLAIRRRRNSFVPRKVAELGSTKETSLTKRQMTNPQAKQMSQHTAIDQPHAPDPAKQKSLKYQKQSCKATKSDLDKQNDGAVSQKQSRLLQTQNIAGLGNQSARSAFKMSKDLIVNKCIEVKQKLQSIAWSPTSRRRASPVSEKSTSNVVEQLPTPVRKAARCKS